jgi:tripartite-type tricarboxylate transporter receptor subunit TctC
MRPLNAAQALLCAAALVLGLAPAAAQYPAKPITVMVSGPPGGPLDAVTRGVFAKVGERLGNQTVVIENRAGAGGILAVTAVTRAAPDGYTLLSTIDPPIVATPSLVKSVPYDPLKDLIPIALLGDGGDNVLVVPASSAVKTVPELVASLRADTQNANYSSSGNGGPGHLLGELFNRQAGTEAVHIPHKGSPDALNALLAGRVAFGFIPVGLAQPQVSAGKLRALAVAATERNPLLPSLPTVAETGIKDFNPAPMVDHRLRSGADAARRRAEAERGGAGGDAVADVAELLRKQALRPSQDAPEKVTERVRNDNRLLSRVIKELGITTE